MAAEEYLNNTIEGNSIWGDLLKDNGDVYYQDDVIRVMKEYAKLCCDKQKQICADNADADCNILDYPDVEVYVIKDSILNSPYPEELN